MTYPLITQYRLALTPCAPCRPRPEWGYRLYAALLEQAGQGFARRLHEEGPNPLSQYLAAGPDGAAVWYVTLLGEASHAALGEILARQPSFFLRAERLALDVAGREKRTVPDVDALLRRGEACAPRHLLRFCTPTAFKSRGEYQPLPAARLMLQGLVRKWNASFPECPIEDTDGKGVDAMADGLRLERFRLESRAYCLKGNAVFGFVGDLTLKNRLEGFHRTLANALLLFAPYAGVGIKTTLGMGGVQREDGEK